MAGVKRGEIKKLLVLESLPKPINYTGGMDPLTYGGSFTLERVLGTVPVEADGSAALQVPALRRVFVSLDANDLAVKRMQSFVSVQPGEVTGCIGCHEQRTQTFQPRNPAAAVTAPAQPDRTDRRLPGRLRLSPGYSADPRPAVRRLPRLREDPARRALRRQGYPDRRPGPDVLARLFHHDRPPPILGQPQPAAQQLSAAGAGLVGQPHPANAGWLPPRRAGRRPQSGKCCAVDRGRGPHPGTYAALGCGSIGSLRRQQGGQRRLGLAHHQGRRQGDRPSLRLLPPGRQRLAACPVG